MWFRIRFSGIILRTDRCCSSVQYLDHLSNYDTKSPGFVVSLLMTSTMKFSSIWDARKWRTTAQPCACTAVVSLMCSYCHAILLTNVLCISTHI
jgi:hypothetical protein